MLIFSPNNVPFEAHIQKTICLIKHQTSNIICFKSGSMQHVVQQSARCRYQNMYAFPKPSFFRVSVFATAQMSHNNPLKRLKEIEKCNKKNVYD